MAFFFLLCINPFFGVIQRRIKFQTIQFSIVFCYPQLNVKTVQFQRIPFSINSFQTIQFSISTQFQCQKKVLFQPIQFLISIQFSSIWPIDKTLSGATTQGQRWPESDAIKGFSTFPEAAVLLEPQHQIV